MYAGKIFRLNDRVMQMRNNYDIKLYDRSGKQVGEGIFNGDIGTIRKISGTNVVIEFDGRYMDCPQVLLDDLELSYAITIHKSMGSEYDTVIIPLLAAHNVLLTRNLLYTAITRAKRRVLLVGEKRALYMAIHRSRKENAIPCWANASPSTIRQSRARLSVTKRAKNGSVPVNVR